GLGQRGAEPAFGLLTGATGDRGDDSAQVLAFLLERHPGLEDRVVLAVSEPGPATLAALFDNTWITLADVRIEQHTGADRVFVQDVHRAPDADARTVVAPAVVQRIRLERGGPAENAGGWPVNFIVLDVQADPESH